MDAAPVSSLLLFSACPSVLSIWILTTFFRLCKYRGAQESSTSKKWKTGNCTHLWRGGSGAVSRVVSPHYRATVCVNYIEWWLGWKWSCWFLCPSFFFLEMGRFLNISVTRGTRITIDLSIVTSPFSLCICGKEIESIILSLDIENSKFHFTPLSSNRVVQSKRRRESPNVNFLILCEMQRI